ncbi:replication-associated recombination protein A [Paracrocinitomix mangrovi]|uniref:replication-associated recombination protein A n=1 Tax=Paracrocinitomix mangrovi TaxID=2862509 RepID=UPI001C8E7D11|nr:replication-associated recombination protein A [Paracrocinitomix mangrovi]UKN02158.1 replication-associated recombination protein A [Paracrocinitomix mangrovi]
MSAIPLAERMRPTTLEEYIGQSHILGEGTGLRKTISSGNIPSMIFWGPPGVGKTTLAQIIANTVDRPFYSLSAINSGVKDIREIIDKVNSQGLFGGSNAILFIDEIHRFSKSQQDSLLGAVEKGIITLIGATTENPSFEVISALLSRCQVYTLKSHSVEELTELLNRAIEKDAELKKYKVQLKETSALFKISGGDARKMLNGLEMVISQIGGAEVEITDKAVTSVLQQNIARYDKDGEQHYDIISAFIKSIRGSDPNAALYWLARMVEGGEDPKFIARRLIISASEDIGLANPNALMMANAAFDAINKIGWPEGRIVLAQATVYLASSPKGNGSYMAIKKAQAVVQQTGNLPVPLHLRNAPTKLMKDLGYGEDYKYSHDGANNFVNQEFMPDEIVGTNFFDAGSSKKEQEIAQTIKNLWGDKYE